MPILVIVLAIILVATFGFWDTLQAALGGILLVVVVAAVIVALLVAGVRAVLRSRGRM